MYKDSPLDPDIENKVSWLAASLMTLTRAYSYDSYGTEQAPLNRISLAVISVVKINKGIMERIDVVRLLSKTLYACYQSFSMLARIIHCGEED